MLKSCRRKMATLPRDVCDVHGASSLYIKPVAKVLLYMYLYNMYNIYALYIYIYYIYIYTYRYVYIYILYIPYSEELPPPAKNFLIPLPLSTKFLFRPHQKNKNVIFSCTRCSCTIFVLI